MPAPVPFHDWPRARQRASVLAIVSNSPHLVSAYDVAGQLGARYSDVIPVMAELIGSQLVQANGQINAGGQYVTGYAAVS